jgi:SHS2 domain-containing protein
VEFELPPGRDEDLLVSLLDEVIFRMETEDLLPLHAEVLPSPGGSLRVRLTTTGTHDVRPVGAIPKAVSLHELRFGTGPDGWRCSVTLDV